MPAPSQMVNRPLKTLCNEIANASLSFLARAESAEAAAVRLSKQMLGHKSVFLDESGFMCNEENYGDGDVTYLTNAQGLVGVLLPYVEIEWAIPDKKDRELIKLAAEDVIEQAQSSAGGYFFDLDPYVKPGPIRKALEKGPHTTRDFNTTHGVAWTLSALTLLYTGVILDKFDGSEEKRISDGIENTYGLLLDLFLTEGWRAGWGWCSLSEKPDLYHTWSAAQTLGDLDDYILSPDNPRLKGDGRRSGLEARLRKVAAERAKASRLSSTADIYLQCSKWLYQELFGSNVNAIADMLVGNSEEARIYYELLCLESLVYMQADERLAEVLGQGTEKLKNTFTARLRRAAETLSALRETAWYQEVSVSTLRVPLFEAGPLALGDTWLLEPCLEPLALRSLSYGPQYLGSSEFEQPVREAILQHVEALRPEDLWDTTAANFVICERTVEAFIMLRNMFLRLHEEAGIKTRTARPSVPVVQSERGLQLVLPLDQVEVIADAVLAKLRPSVEEQVRQVIATTATAGGDGGEWMELLDAAPYRDLLAPDEIAKVLDEPGFKRPEPEQYRAMFLELVVRILVAALNTAKPSEGKDQAALSPQLIDALAHAVAAVLPKAFGYYAENLLEVTEDTVDLKDNFRIADIESQFKLVVLRYLQTEFHAGTRLDFGKHLARVFEEMDRQPVKQSESRLQS